MCQGEGVRIRLPEAPVAEEEKKLSFSTIAARWRVPAALVRYELERAGVPMVDVVQPPRKGVRLSDLLAFEESVRRGESSTVQARTNYVPPELTVVRVN